MALHLYEFLYRGRPAGSDQPPDYHVVLADDGTDAFGQTFYALSQAMTPAQGEKLGFGLPAIVDAINTAVMTENASLKALNAEILASIPDLPQSAPADPASAA